MSFRAVGSAPFGEGPQALLDVACKVAREGVVLPAEVAEAGKEVSAEVQGLPTARVRETIETVIMSPNLGEGLQWLHDCGVLKWVLPELDATVDFSQEAGRRHKDVWEHTKQVIRQSPERSIVRWSALLHDIGKVPTRVLLPDGRVTFHRHAEVGARMFDSVARRLGFDRQEKNRIKFLIMHHLRANAYETSWTDAAVRRFDHEMGGHLDDLIELSRADVTSRRPGRRQEAARNIEALLSRITAIRDLDARVPPLPPGLGNAIMETFAIPPSKRVGELRKICEDAVEKGELQERQPPEYYVDFLKTRGHAG
jgi:poly(A) polymerase